MIDILNWISNHQEVAFWIGLFLIFALGRICVLILRIVKIRNGYDVEYDDDDDFGLLP